jgi:hypothetical protein
MYLLYVEKTCLLCKYYKYVALYFLTFSSTLAYLYHTNIFFDANRVRYFHVGTV